VSAESSSPNFRYLLKISLVELSIQAIDLSTLLNRDKTFSLCAEPTQLLMIQD